MILNLTPHEIRIGKRVFPSEGTIRVISAKPKLIGTIEGIRIYSNIHGSRLEFRDKSGMIASLPGIREGVFYIVSTMVAEFSNRGDFLSPGTGNGDRPIRENGMVVGVTSLKGNPIVRVLRKTDRIEEIYRGSFGEYSGGLGKFQDGETIILRTMEILK